MLRLLVAHNEKSIRESIGSLIDWESLGIEILSVCKDGTEAWQCILDDAPDIVLTDLNLPGMPGFDLLSRTHAKNPDIAFVILTRQNDFLCAKEAMRYGVFHYLLIPCDAKELAAAMKETADQCSRKKSERMNERQIRSLSSDLKSAVIRDTLLLTLTTKSSFHTVVHRTSPRTNPDFNSTSYELCSFSPLEENDLSDCLHEIYLYFEHLERDTDAVIRPNILYVHKRLLLLFETPDTGGSSFDQTAENFLGTFLLFQTEYRRLSFSDLETALDFLTGEINHYELVYLIDESEKFPLRNLSRILDSTKECLKKITKKTRMSDPPVVELLSLLQSIDDPATLKTTLTDMLLNQNSDPDMKKSPLVLTEFLIKISEMETTGQILSLFEKECPKLLLSTDQTPVRQKDFIGRTLRYIDQNLSDSHLSLKYIAQNYLFMNVDYVSKQFMKQTGVKFSAYLANARIEKAKQLLLNGETSIYSVAEEVGFGNNPQYFSQIFKKNTGMTPTAYIKAMKGSTQ